MMSCLLEALRRADVEPRQLAAGQGPVAFTEFSGEGQHQMLCPLLGPGIVGTGCPGLENGSGIRTIALVEAYRCRDAG